LLVSPPPEKQGGIRGAWKKWWASVYVMKAKQSIGGSLAVAALVSYWLASTVRRSHQQQKIQESRFTKEAIDTFEGEGGLVLE
jgi:hypothetical protein